MFNMQDMVADMLKKSIPPEVMAMLTAEKLKEIGDKATAFVSDIRGSLDRIEATQATIVMQNETAYERQTRILEALAEIKSHDDGSSNDGSKPRQRRNVRASTSGLASDSGDGSPTG